MSTEENERRTDHRGLTISSMAFLVLLVLALIWPAPVLWLNDATFQAPLEIDERSFLGREAPQWDVVFWGIAGVFVLALFHAKAREVRRAWDEFRSETRLFPQRVAARWRSLEASRVLGAAGLAAVVIALVWGVLDSPGIALAERLDSEAVRDVIRIFNRLGGGMNPLMIVFFFAIAGMLFAHPYWAQMAVAMAAAAAGAGILVQVLKITVGRTRPEVWLGPFHHVLPSASSFPSGHTVGAFAIAGVLAFGSRNLWLRLAGLGVATAIACSRVLTLRHWPSDVIAAAILGLVFGWFFATAVKEQGLGAGG